MTTIIASDTLQYSTGGSQITVTSDYTGSWWLYYSTSGGHEDYILGVCPGEVDDSRGWTGYTTRLYKNGAPYGVAHNEGSFSEDFTDININNGDIISVSISGETGCVIEGWGNYYAGTANSLQIKFDIDSGNGDILMRFMT